MILHMLFTAAFDRSSIAGRLSFQELQAFHSPWRLMEKLNFITLDPHHSSQLSKGPEISPSSYLIYNRPFFLVSFGIASSPSLKF